MKKLTILACLAATLTYGQTDLTLYQLTNVPTSNMLNPGFRPEADLAIGFPVLTSLGAHVHNSGFELRTLIGVDTDINTAIQGIAAGMDDMDHVSVNVRSDLLYGGFGVGNGYVSLGAGTYTFINFDYPADLLRFLWPSSEDFSEVSFNLEGTDYEALNATFYHVGYQHNLMKDKLSVGVRGKYFTGIQHAFIENFDGTIQSNAEQMMVTTDILIRTAGVASLSDGDDIDIGSLLFPQNSGFAIDLGFSYSITDRWEVSGSVLNLGSINFNQDLRQITSQGTYDFRGVEYDPSNEDLTFDDLLDELDSTFNFVEEDGISYSRSLPMEAYFNVTHSFNRTHHLSAMYHLRSWSGEAFHDLGFSYQAKLGKTFNFILGYNMINGTWNNISSGFSLNMGSFQWHLMSDNAYGLMYPGRTHTVNIRTGFSFRFGRNRLEDRLAKFDSEVPIVQPVPAETNTPAESPDENN